MKNKRLETCKKSECGSCKLKDECLGFTPDQLKERGGKKDGKN